MAKALEPTTSRDYQQRIAGEILRVRGGSRRPDPPRNLRAQSGSRKVLLVWNEPEMSGDVAGYDIARGTESNLVNKVEADIHQLEVPSTAAATSPTVLFCVRSRNKLGLVSNWVYVTGKASDEAGAPTDPDPPPDYYNDPGAGGGEDPREGHQREVL